ncbi:unnamed protein product [Rotaria magnacalcarata]|nr:unnamed protein product [Rotaria magnacalcarata]
MESIFDELATQSKEDDWADVVATIEKNRIDQNEIENEENPEFELIHKKKKKSNNIIDLKQSCYSSNEIRSLLESMSEEQQHVFYRVREWCTKRLRNPGIEPIRVFITGGAGTVGKLQHKMNLRKILHQPLVYLLLVCLLLVFTFIGTLVYSENVAATYTVNKDFFNVMKAPQFSIYDASEQQLHYRIQSKFSLWHIIEIISYPSNELIAKLRSQWFIWLYAANISIFDSPSNQWINGSIHKNLAFFGDKYTIVWNGKVIVMETKFASLITKFHDQQQGNLSAKFHKRWISFVWSDKYDLEIFSKEIPDTLYMLALAAKDYTDSQAQKDSEYKATSRN